MKATALTFLLAATVPVMANEALDLLEGRNESAILNSPPISVSDSDGAGSVGEPAPARDWDYHNRSMRTLPPLLSVYRDEDNPVVQEVSFNGLYEWRTEGGSVKPDTGAETDIDDSGTRRARLGASVRAFYNTELEAKTVFDGTDYRGIDTLRATVDVADGVTIAAGKFRAPFSGEYSLDPSVRVTPEMAPLNRQIVPANTLGGMVAVQSGPWDVAAGYFAGDVDKNVPDLNGEGFILGKLAYTFEGPPLGGEDATDGSNTYQRWHLDYIYNLDRDTSSSIPMAYKHLASTGIEISSERLDLLVDLLIANGDVNTAWGLTILGSYWLYEDAVQLVGRYHYADTSDKNGLTVGYGLADAFSDSIHPQMYPTTFTTDELHSIYGGVNFYLFENYLLLNTGIECQLLKDNDDTTMNADSWIWQAGGRVAF